MASTELAVRADEWKLVTDLVLDGISSSHTRRAYSQALEEFLIWFRDEPGRQFNKAAVQKYRTELETKGLAPSSINVRLSAIRRLALEASDNGLLEPELAAGIARAKGARHSGVRLGHWLTAEQVGGQYFGVTRHGKVTLQRISTQAVFAIVKSYAGELGICFSPHDLRRTFAKLAHAVTPPWSRFSFRWATLRWSRRSSTWA
jgi:site-specific recombinase XerD